MTMAICIIVLAIAAGFHFVYEATLAPSFRQKIRFKLFALRDELRRLKLEQNEELSDDAFRYLEESLNNLLDLLGELSFPMVWEAMEAIVKDKGLQQRIERRRRVLEECSLEAVKRIRRECNELGQFAIVANHGAWMALIIPVLIMIGIAKKVTEWLTTLVLVPEKEIPRIVPAPSAVPA